MVRAAAAGRGRWLLSGFGRRLAAIAAVGTVVQVLYVALARWGESWYDGPIYSADANLLAAGQGFISSQALQFEGVIRESAIHPPLVPMWLAISSLGGFDGLLAHQLWSIVPGVATIIAIGLLGREVSGERVGLVAAAIAAIHPGVWSHPGTIMSETAAQLFVALMLLGAYAWWRDPRPLVMAGTVAAGSMAALARSENVLLLGIVVLVLVLRREGLDLRRRAVMLGVAALWGGTLLAPWVIFNQVRIGPEVTFATAADVALPGANCDAAYDGWAIGYWEPQCRIAVLTEAPPPKPEPMVCGEEGSRIGWTTGAWDIRCVRIVAWSAPEDPRLIDEGEMMAINREIGLRYAGEHLDRVPVVVAYRVARTFSIGDPLSLAAFESFRERREVPVLVASSLAFYVTAALAVGGGRVLRRRGVLVWPLLAPILTAVAAGALTHGTSRYRAPVDVGLIVLSAVWLETWWATRSGASAVVADDDALDALTTSPS